MPPAVDPSLNATDRNWIRTETPRFWIWHHPEEESLTEIQCQLNRAYDDTSDFLGCQLQERITVVLCQNYEELWLATRHRPQSLLSACEDTLVCLRLAKWAETWSRIYRNPYPSQQQAENNLLSLLTHELCHIFCYRLFGAETLSHRWFMEGLADCAGNRRGRLMNVLSEARQQGLFFSDLGSLNRAFDWTATPRDKWERRWIAYAQSCDMVMSLLECGGKEKVVQLFQKAQGSQISFEQLFDEVFQVAPEELLRRWLGRQIVSSPETSSLTGQ